MERTHGCGSFVRPGAAKDTQQAQDLALQLKEKLQLPVPFSEDLAPVAADRILVYQDVRYFGQGVVDDVSVWYSAFAIYILPVLYALFGTCVYLVRTFEQEMSNRTFKPSHADFHRFLVAGIAGAVAGFFSNFAINTGTSVSPLAAAFLAGYAIDVFFSFLDGFMQAFMKDKQVPGGASAAVSDGM
jgi:hypothetical protein